MAKLAVCLGLVLAILCGDRAVSRASGGDLVAIDVLLLPDATMVEQARAINRRLRQDMPGGFALDRTHVPHMTLLQCFVRTADLGAVEAAVSEVFRQDRPRGMPLTASALFDGPVGEVRVTGISVDRAPALTRLQQEIALAAQPFIRHTGTAASFVDAPASGTTGWTVAYVDHFLTNSSGARYSPHVTAGVGRPDFVARLRSEPFTPFHFTIRGAAIYQLGDVGTARKLLWTWQP